MSEKGVWVKPAKRTTRRLKDLLSEEELSILENNEPVVAVTPTKVTPKKITRASTRKFKDLDIENKFDTHPAKARRASNADQEKHARQEVAPSTTSKNTSQNKPKGRPVKAKKPTETPKKSSKKRAAEKMLEDVDMLPQHQSNSWMYVCVASLGAFIMMLIIATYYINLNGSHNSQQ